MSEISDNNKHAIHTLTKSLIKAKHININFLQHTTKNGNQEKVLLISEFLKQDIHPDKIKYKQALLRINKNKNRITTMVS